MPRLLLSDASETIQRIVTLMFAAEDIAVTAVNNGDAAIACIARERPDIVLAALSTPGKSGYDVAAFVKSTPALASIPVLLVVGAFEPFDQDRADEVRSDGVLIKPLESAQVIARVRGLLAGSARPLDAPLEPPRDLPRGVPAPRIQPELGEPVLPRIEAGGQPSPESSAQVDELFERLDTALAQRRLTTTPLEPDGDDRVPTLDTVLGDGGRGDAPPAAPAPAAMVTPALVDEVARQVVERLGTPAVREVVADVVADMAERLIREEIARIRTRS